jgi:hypothetical protein
MCAKRQDAIGNCARRVPAGVRRLTSPAPTPAHEPPPAPRGRQVIRQLAAVCSAPRIMIEIAAMGGAEDDERSRSKVEPSSSSRRWGLTGGASAR